MTDQHVDILIVGGGLVGLAFMRALRHTRLRILLVDPQKNLPQFSDHFDARSLTLSPASVNILKGLEVWDQLAHAVQPIQNIHVSEQGRFGTAVLEGSLENPLGHVLSITRLHEILYQSVTAGTESSQEIWMPAKVIACDPLTNRITVQKEERQITLSADLVIAADGTNSPMRGFCDLSAEIKEYGQVALVTHLELNRAHQNYAYERFTQNGPLALLPLARKRMGLAWSMPPLQAEKLLQMNEVEFLQQLMHTFGYRVGRFVKVGQRMVYPLRQIFMRQQIYRAVVFIGNAAHTLHPVAGQGFNLGLRDAAMLAQAICQKGLNDPDMLAHYQQQRQHDQKSIMHLTDFLARFYTHSAKGMGIVRQLGLIGVDNHRMFKRMLARYASGFAGVIPDLVCGLSLEDHACTQK